MPGRTSNLVWRLSAAVIASFALACDSETHVSTDVMPPDIPIVALANDPALSFGNEEGRPGHQLFGVVGAIRRRDGGIFLVNAGTKEIRLFDHTGDLVRSVGRNGAGPGEFRLIRSATRVDDDGVAVWDPALDRVTVLNSRGDVVRLIHLVGGVQIQLDGRPVPGSPSNLHVLPDGIVVAELGFPTSVLTRGGDGIRRDTIALAVFDKTGRLANLVGPIAAAEWYVKDGSALPRPYGHRLLVTAVNQEVFVGTGKGPIEVFLTNGDRLRSLDVAFPQLPLSAKDLTAAKEHMLSHTWPGSLAGTEEMLADVPMPKRSPAYSRLMNSAEGDLWVRGFVQPDDSVQHWIAISPEGETKFQLEFARELQLLDCGGDYVVVLFKDELEREQIRVYPLVRR